jgi:hypothetical protein
MITLSAPFEFTADGNPIPIYDPQTRQQKIGTAMKLQSDNTTPAKIAIKRVSGFHRGWWNKRKDQRSRRFCRRLKLRKGH